MKRSMLFFLVSLAVATSVLAADAPSIPSLLVRGVLLDHQGAPARAQVLHVAPSDPAGKSFVELRDGEILNPTVTTDDGGRFSFVVPIAFFAAGNAFTVGAARVDSLPHGSAELALVPVRRNGAAASFSYRGKRETIDLGEVTLAAPETR